MPPPLDFAMAAVIAVLWPAWEYFVAWPGDVQRIDSGLPSARLHLYRRTLVIEWALVAATAFAWRAQGHPWDALPLFSPTAWRIGAGVGAVLAIAALMTQQVRLMRRSAKARVAMRRKTSILERILPRTTAERTWFVLLSVTAGVCEEWLYRGILTTLFAGWFGLPLAVLLANVAFGFAHAYQGRSGIVSTGIVGLVMSGIVLATGSLVPAMLVHAIIDVGSGLGAYEALTRPPEAEPGGEG